MLVCRRYCCISLENGVFHWNISRNTSEIVLLSWKYSLRTKIHLIVIHSPLFSWLGPARSSLSSCVEWKETKQTLLLIHWRILTSLSVSHSRDSLPSYWRGHSSEQFARENLMGVISTTINFTKSRIFWKIFVSNRLCVVSCEKNFVF